MIALRGAGNGARVDPDPWYLTVAPSIITGEQYDALLRCFARSPETELMVAVMADALSVCIRHVGRPSAKGRREFEEARRWFASDNASGPFTFLNICTALDLEPEAVRQALATTEDSERHAGSTGRRSTIRRGGGRRHSVRPSTAAQVPALRPARLPRPARDATVA